MKRTLSVNKKISEIGQLIEKAKLVCGAFQLERDLSAGLVGAAIMSDSGRIYSGICIDLGCGLGFCAEVAAMAEMLKNREKVIKMMVAVSENQILIPCGRCREMAAQIDQRNMDAKVIISSEKTIQLKDLLPHHWLSTHQLSSKS